MYPLPVNTLLLMHEELLNSVRNPHDAETIRRPPPPAGEPCPDPVGMIWMKLHPRDALETATAWLSRLSHPSRRPT